MKCRGRLHSGTPLRSAALGAIPAQAFSHFSFEYAQRRSIIVDIQGVGCCWTDPQLHPLRPGDFPALVFGLRQQDVTDVLAHFLDRRVPLPLAKGPQEAV